MREREKKEEGEWNNKISIKISLKQLLSSEGIINFHHDFVINYSFAFSFKRLGGGSVLRKKWKRKMILFPFPHFCRGERDLSFTRFLCSDGKPWIFTHKSLVFIIFYGGKSGGVEATQIYRRRGWKSFSQQFLINEDFLVNFQPSLVFCTAAANVSTQFFFINLNLIS